MVFSDLSDLILIILLEVILGIDNIIFIALVVKNLKQARLVKIIALSLAFLIRLVMVFFINQIIAFDAIKVLSLSMKDLIPLVGGAFLFFTSVKEALKFIKQDRSNLHAIPTQSGFIHAIIQVIAIDVIFSLDSVVVAIGITEKIMVISLAFAVTTVLIVVFSSQLVRFIKNHREFTAMAISLVLMVGVKLMLDGLSFSISKVMFYVCVIGFSVIIGLLYKKFAKSMKKQL